MFFGFGLFAAFRLEAPTAPNNRLAFAYVPLSLFDTTLAFKKALPVTQSGTTTVVAQRGLSASEVRGRRSCTSNFVVV
jgi:hypothetical protein